MVSAIVLESSSKFIEDNVDFGDNIECTAPRTDDEYIESTFTAGAETVSLEGTTWSEIIHDGDGEVKCFLEIEEQPSAWARVEKIVTGSEEKQCTLICLLHRFQKYPLRERRNGLTLQALIPFEVKCGALLIQPT